MTTLTTLKGVFRLWPQTPDPIRAYLTRVTARNASWSAPPTRHWRPALDTALDPLALARFEGATNGGARFFTRFVDEPGCSYLGHERLYVDTRVVNFDAEVEMFLAFIRVYAHAFEDVVVGVEASRYRVQRVTRTTRGYDRRTDVNEIRAVTVLDGVGVMREAVYDHQRYRPCSGPGSIPRRLGT